MNGSNCAHCSLKKFERKAQEATVQQPFSEKLYIIGNRVRRLLSFFPNSKNNFHQSLLPTDRVNVFFRESEKRCLRMIRFATRYSLRMIRFATCCSSQKI